MSSSLQRVLLLAYNFPTPGVVTPVENMEVRFFSWINYDNQIDVAIQRKLCVPNCLNLLKNIYFLFALRSHSYLTVKYLKSNTKVFFFFVFFCLVGYGYLKAIFVRELAQSDCQNIKTSIYNQQPS